MFTCVQKNCDDGAPLLQELLVVGGHLCAKELWWLRFEEEEEEMFWWRRWCLMEENKIHTYLLKIEKWRRTWLKGRPIRIIICKGPARPDIIWWAGNLLNKLPAHQNDHFQKAGPSGWSFAKGLPVRIIFCKRPAHQNDHLQKAGPSGWSFAKGWPIQIIFCKRPAHQKQ